VRRNAANRHASIAAIETVTCNVRRNYIRSRNFRGEIPARQSDKRRALSPRPLEFNSHTICAAGRRPDLNRVHNCRLGQCSPADSRSKYAIRLRWDLDTAHNCRPAPYNPAGSRSKFARHSRNRMVAAAGNSTEHSLGLRRQRLLRQSMHLPTQSLLSYAWQSSQLVRSSLAFQRRKASG
jgi:hypothetical protein